MAILVRLTKCTHDVKVVMTTTVPLPNENLVGPADIVDISEDWWWINSIVALREPPSTNWSVLIDNQGQKCPSVPSDV